MCRRSSSSAFWRALSAVDTSRPTRIRRPSFPDEPVRTPATPLARLPHLTLSGAMCTYDCYRAYMAVRRTTIEIDEDLLAWAKRALGQSTVRATVELALRQAAATADAHTADRAEEQRRLLRRLPTMVDVDVLVSDKMWR